MRQYFHKPYEPLRGQINVKVDVSHYVIKAGFALKLLISH